MARFFGLRKTPEEGQAFVASSRHPGLKRDLTQLNDSVYEVHNPPLPGLEVVFFHGVLDDFEDPYYTTWLSQDKSQLWLKTLLSEAFPTARILTVSYNSDGRSTKERWSGDMYTTGGNLVHDLTHSLVGQAGCPVVLVGYCVGGLMLKQVCVMAAWLLARRGANWDGAKPLKDFLSNLRGVFYFGTGHTPLSHYGSLVDWNFSARLNQEFRELRATCGWEAAGIWEQRETFVNNRGKSMVVIEQASARMDVDAFYTVDVDHYNVSKPTKRDSEHFLFFESFLRKIVAESRPAREDFTVKPEKEGPAQWYDDPITYEMMCDPVKCSDCMTYDRWTIVDHGKMRSPYSLIDEPLSILFDDLPVRQRLFEEFPEQETIYGERRGKYRGEALQHARADPIELNKAIEKLNNVLLWRPLDPECQTELAEIRNKYFKAVPTPEMIAKEVPNPETPTEARPYKISVISHEEVIRAKETDFDTRLVNFLVFLGIAVCFFMTIVPEYSTCRLVC